jgi:predicted DNA-binding WGR domain protein
LKIKSRKVGSADPGEFTETVKFEVVACGNISGNNNKFYCLELQRKPGTSEYQLFTHYGRIDKTNIYEVRDTTSELGDLDLEYAKILKKKKSKSKGYQTVDTQEPSVGSYNIRGKASTASTGASSKGDLKILSLFDDNTVKSMVQGVFNENIHNIANMTTMNVSSSGISSPLGPLTLAHLENASGVLEGIKAEYSRIFC